MEMCLAGRETCGSSLSLRILTRAISALNKSLHIGSVISKVRSDAWYSLLLWILAAVGSLLLSSITDVSGFLVKSNIFPNNRPC